MKVKVESDSYGTSPSLSSSAKSSSFSSSFSPTSVASHPKSDILSGSGYVSASSLIRNQSTGVPKATSNGTAAGLQPPQTKYKLQKSRKPLSFPSSQKNKSVSLVAYHMKTVNPADVAIAWKLRKLNTDGCYMSLWLEKIFTDSVRSSDTNDPVSWASQYLFLKDTMTWFENDSPVMNDKNFPVRLFIQSFSKPDIFNGEQLLEMGKDIVKELNSIKGVRENVMLDLQSINSARKFCWQEVIGSRQAFAMMRQEIGESEIVDSSYYQKFKDIIHIYFRENSLHPDIARKVGAPNNQIDPQYLHVENHKPN